MAIPYYPMYQSPYSFYPATYPASYTPQAVQQTSQNFSQTIPQNSMIWVSGESEAAGYPVAPNNAVALWEQSGKVIYVKSADATGKPSLKVYDLVERSDYSSEKSDSKSDNDAIMKAISGFSAKIDAITADIESMKGDLYGLSGRKKTVKRVEVSDDDE